MKTKFIVAGAALCLLSVTGCDNDAIEKSDLQSGQKVLMTMQTSGPQTRVDYTDNGTNMSFSWRSADELSVVVDGVTGNENCQLATSTAGKSVPFSGTVTAFTGTKKIYAFYPFSQSGYTVTGGSTPSTATAALTLPNPQTYTIGGALSNSFMVGIGTATATATAIHASAGLKQVMSVIKLNITNAPGKVIGVKLRSAEALFPTTATVSLSDGTISNPGTLASKLSMAVTDGTSGTDKEVFLAMFPVDLRTKTFSVEVYFEGGLVKSIDKAGVLFARNTFYVMPFDATGAWAYHYIDPAGFGVGLEWATGNLVANGANSARIGAPEDGGLFFQFGSLIGWSGGATGDGTGRGTDLVTPALSQRLTPVGYTGSPTWDTGWVGDAATQNVATGTGDPCRYYLGGLWRLPKGSDFVSLIADNSGYPNAGPWTAVGTFTSGSSDSYLVHTSGLKFSISGSRGDVNGGGFYDVGVIGSYWSNDARVFSITSSVLNPSNGANRFAGVPVRCVRD